MIYYPYPIPKKIEEQIKSSIDTDLYTSLLTPIQGGSTASKIAVVCPSCGRKAYLYKNDKNKYKYPAFICYHSNGCTFGGKSLNIFDLLEYIKNLKYKDALLWIADANNLARLLPDAVRTGDAPKIERCKKENDVQAEITYLGVEIVEQYMNNFADTNLYKYMTETLRIHQDTVSRQAEMYCIGGISMPNWQSITNKAVTIPQVDKDGNVVDIRIMAFQPDGRRVKYKNKDGEIIGLMSTARKILQTSGDKAAQPLFGEHLAFMQQDFSYIAVVESEKTALIMSCLIPKVLWLATCSMDMITPHSALHKLEPFAHMPIRLIPDRNAVEKWQAIADEHAGAMNIQCCSNLITAYFDEYRIVNGKKEKVKDDLLDVFDDLCTNEKYLSMGDAMVRSLVKDNINRIQQAIINPNITY